MKPQVVVACSDGKEMHKKRRDARAKMFFLLHKSIAFFLAAVALVIDKAP